jgi:hypothetical protein
MAEASRPERSPVARNAGSVAGVLWYVGGRGRPTLRLPRTAHRPRRPDGPHTGPVRAYDPGSVGPGVVARSDVDAVPGHPGQGSGPMLRPWWRHDGCVPEVDDDQLAALRRLRVAFGPIEVVEVISHDPAAARMSRLRGRGGGQIRGG